MPAKASTSSRPSCLAKHQKTSIADMAKDNPILDGPLAGVLAKTVQTAYLSAKTIKKSLYIHIVMAYSSTDICSRSGILHSKGSWRASSSAPACPSRSPIDETLQHVHFVLNWTGQASGKYWWFRWAPSAGCCQLGTLFHSFYYLFLFTIVTDPTYWLGSSALFSMHFHPWSEGAIRVWLCHLGSTLQELHCQLQDRLYFHSASRFSGPDGSVDRALEWSGPRQYVVYPSFSLFIVNVLS